MGTPIVTGVDAPPVFEFSEHVLDLVAAFVERTIERDFGFTIGFWRNAGLDAARFERLAEPICIVALVAEQGFCIRNGVKH